jgi:hypothetical protein
VSSPASRFATAVACIDGRIQSPIADWIHRHHAVEHVDMVTEPGIDALLGAGDEDATASVVRRVAISRDAHAARVVAISGHADCAANPVAEPEHRRQVVAAVTRMRDLMPEVAVFGLWVDADGAVSEVLEGAVPARAS